MYFIILYSISSCIIIKRFCRLFHRWLDTKQSLTVEHPCFWHVTRIRDYKSSTITKYLLLNKVGLAEDEMQICPSLLANRNLKVKIQEFLSDTFETTLGRPCIRILTFSNTVCLIPLECSAEIAEAHSTAGPT